MALGKSLRLGWIARALAMVLALAIGTQRAIAQATCADGTTSSSHGRGTCSHHGGVASVGTGTSTATGTTSTDTGKTKASTPASSTGSQPPAPAGATALCNDGTYSFSAHRSGTCSHHKGVSRWLSASGP
ncbi:MAG: DUF3761 domain-containing protein [Terracidiphilus sp.]